jgi:hypothetical protein
MCVYTLAGQGILTPDEFLAVSRDEESDLARGQTVVLHAQVDREPSDDLRCGASRVRADIIQDLFTQTA